MQETQILIAIEFGKIAFKNGKKSIPCLDNNLMDMMKDMPVGQESITLLKAWYMGWNHASQRRHKLDWSKRLRLRRETNKLHRQSLRQYADEKKATLIKYWEKVNELRVLESRRDCRKG